MQNRALGRAVHSAIAENFRQKIETKEDLPTAGSFEGAPGPCTCGSGLAAGL